MASIDDSGSDTEEFFNTLARDARRPVPDLKATGFCLWCDEEIDSGRRWCNADCREDYERSSRG